jgi:Methyltransferase domain
MTAALEHWLAAVEARHRSALAPREYLKAVRALSARYVERRTALPDRSPLDSAGKRAAFAAFYAVRHLLTVQEAVRALGAGRTPPAEIVDLGCGTGVASSAWAIACESRPRITGVDTHAWALTEAKWTWATLGLAGRTRRADLVAAAERLAARPGTPARRTGVVLGWSVNELPPGARPRLLDALLRCVAAGATLLILEPVARAAAPWWDQWAAAIAQAGGRADLWAFDVRLPEMLERTRAEAGFAGGPLTARSLYATGHPGRASRRGGSARRGPLRLS